ncbi:MAG: methyltransferase domain-containing protein [Chloroflexi bacterium]|nr:methyltransferase domain-containing protein [Chloroflexota bacterium]MBV9896505.1 methyltransferase domain-containing protein [Chloroflexota bacterium]
MAGDISEDPILQLGSGFRAAKLLFVANEVGVFEQLATGPTSLNGLAERTGLAPPRLRVIVNAMLAVGMIEANDGEYRNSPVAAAFLSGPDSEGLRPALRFWNRFSYPVWMKLEDAVRTGQPQSGRASWTEEQQQIFSEGVEAITRGAAQALVDRYDFGRHARVLDLGGGTGSWLVAILRRHSHLRGTLVERAGAAAIARRRLASQSATQNVEVIEGDFFRDPVPPGHDVVLVAHVLHGNTPARNVELLRRIRASVPEGARLLLADDWTNPTHTLPALAPLFAGEFFVFSGEGDVYSEEEVHAWLNESGWRPVGFTALAGPQSVIIAETDQQALGVTTRMRSALR